MRLSTPAQGVVVTIPAENAHAEFLDLTDPPSPVLVVVAHPDDIDFGIAGTVAALTAAGAEVSYALTTSGEAGAPDDLTRAEVGALRRSEQTAAAAEVGVSDIHWLGHSDGRVESSLELRRDISRVIRVVRPQLVITLPSERDWGSTYRSHPDHLATAEATMAAVYPDARNPHAHTELLTDEGLKPHAVPEVWVLSLQPVDVFIDVTDVVERQIAALRQHVSQIDGRFDPGELIPEWMTRIAQTNDLPEGRLAQAYRRCDTA
jgi:LmbE family N-acetylglucosaminyl deacetylase